MVLLFNGVKQKLLASRFKAGTVGRQSEPLTFQLVTVPMLLIEKKDRSFAEVSDTKFGNIHHM